MHLNLEKDLFLIYVYDCLACICMSVYAMHAAPTELKRGCVRVSATGGSSSSKTPCGS